MIDPLSHITPLDEASIKTNDMKLRELADKVYYLLQQCHSPSGRSLIHILSDTHGIHPQQLFEKIYHHLRAQHYERSSNTETEPYLVESRHDYYLKNFRDLHDILALFQIYENRQQIPSYLRKYVSLNMLQSLFENIPRIGVLYSHRHNPSYYQKNHIESISYETFHPDGSKLPEKVKKIVVHKIHKFQGYCIRVWELIPAHPQHSTPICWLPGFLSNAYTFHYEGEQSLDYHLVAQGYHVFLLDHDVEEQDANIDVYTEYLLSTLIDFVKKRTGASRVTLGGHGLGGTLIVFKMILNTVRRPRFITSIQAVLLLNSPINFNAHDFCSPLFLKGFEFLLRFSEKQSNIPLASLLRVFNYIPGALNVLGSVWPNSSQNIPALTSANKHLLARTQLLLQGFTENAQCFKTLLKHGIVNPPRSVLQHILKMIQSDAGAISYNFEEITDSPENELESPAVPAALKQPLKKQVIGIDYMANLHRVPGTIPLLAIQTESDPFSPPEAFFKVWNRWPHLHKLEINASPHTEHSLDAAEQTSSFIKQHGLSSAIGVSVKGGGHMDTIATQKPLIQAFLRSVEEVAASPAAYLHEEVQIYQSLAKSYPLASQQQLEYDFTYKIRSLDASWFRQGQDTMAEALLDIIFQHRSQTPKKEKFSDHMVRITERTVMEEQSSDIYLACIARLLKLSPEPSSLMKEIAHRTQAEPSLPAEAYRTLIDLSIALQDRMNSPSDSGEFYENFEDFLDRCLQHSESSVALHALRGFFHTRKAKFIQKACELYCDLSLDYQQKVYRIYWDEIHKLISELASEYPQQIPQHMDAFWKIYPKIQAPHQKATLSS